MRRQAVHRPEDRLLHRAGGIPFGPHGAVHIPSPFQSGASERDALPAVHAAATQARVTLTSGRGQDIRTHTEFPHCGYVVRYG